MFPSHAPMCYDCANLMKSSLPKGSVSLGPCRAYKKIPRDVFYGVGRCSKFSLKDRGSRRGDNPYVEEAHQKQAALKKSTRNAKTGK